MNEQDTILDMLLQGGFISGEHMAARLGVSRAMLWKHIGALREAGYAIEASTRRGYRLDADDNLRAPCLNAALTTRWLGRAYRYLDETASTNHAARDWAQQGAPHGSVLIAGAQTGGLGRLGRAWSSTEGGLFMTLILRPDIQPRFAPRLTMLAAVAVCRAAEAFGLTPRIKWPNDVLLEGKKLCGILTQMSADMDGITYVLTGIGVNVNQERFDGEVAEVAVSLRQALGKPLDRRMVVDALLNAFEQGYDDCLAEGFPLLKQYEPLCATLGSQVRVYGDGEPYDAVAERLTGEGALVARTADGAERTLLSGDVSIRGKAAFN